jgi:hypothetical protein
MKGLTVGVLSAGLALGLAAEVAPAQKWTGSVPLGDVARQLKAQRAESKKQPRMFTNEDVIALRTASEPPSPSPATSSPSASTEASADHRTNREAAANLARYPSAIYIEWGKATQGEDEIDRMSKVQVVLEAPRKDANNSASVATPAQNSATTRAQAAVKIRQIAAAEPTAAWAKAKFRVGAETAQSDSKTAGHSNPSPAAQAGQNDDVSAPFGEWAKAKYRAAQGARSASGEPGPISASAINSQAVPHQELGYVERSDGKVEAIVAEGQHIGLIEETKEFMKNFHIPAPSPAELEMALAAPPSNPPEADVPEADQPSATASAPDAGSRATENGTDVAQLQQPQTPPSDNAQSQSEASLQAEPLADYAAAQVRPTPPENLQPANAPAFVTAAPDVIANRSSVTPIGYVEKAGGEKEAIVEFQDQVFLVHEGELFAGKYRVLRVTALAVEIAEEPSEASSAAIDRPRNTQVVPEPR